ncbi:MAG: gliding motility protein GldL [Cyclobacteriaceae bacterium]|nr:gliding motility protein GldL [Cyclobacteriaceae bacterium]
MSKRKGGFSELFFGSIMPKIYGIGASVVIAGAMFKILHWPGAGLMLGLGLSTEAIIFFLSAFEPKHKDPDWSKVYPELAEDFDGPARSRTQKGIQQGDSVTQKLDAMMSSAKIGPELLDSLGKGMRTLADSTMKIGKLGDVAQSTESYNLELKNAAGNISKMNKTYVESVNSMMEMANASKGATAELSNASNQAKEYHNQVQAVTKNLGALNAVYEMELNDANSHIKNMNKFYSNLTKTMESISQASDDTEKFKAEIGKLTTNLTKLNSIYGGMINAMKA